MTRADELFSDILEASHYGKIYKVKKEDVIYLNDVTLKIDNYAAWIKSQIEDGYHSESSAQQLNKELKLMYMSI